VARASALATAGAVVVGCSLLGYAPAAQAHNYLISSTPEAGETLTELPELFEITTNEPLLDSVGEGSFALEVRDEAGLYYGDGCVDIDGPSMTTAAALGEPGAYTVIWQVVSADGHTVSEEFGFTWAPGDAATSATSTGTESVPSCSSGGGSGEGGGESTAPASGENMGDAGNAEDTTDGTAANTRENTDLSNVLWIGGAIVLVGLTVGVTLLLGGRKKK
jgi:methionine-rich copper-binding protein CopC